MATMDPVAFVRVVASILPRQLDATVSADPELIDALKDARDFATAFRFAMEAIGAEDLPVIGDKRELDGEECETLELRATPADSDA